MLTEIWIRVRPWPSELWALLRRLPRWSWYLVRDLVVGIFLLAQLAFRWIHMSEERGAARVMENRDGRVREFKAINAQSRIRLIGAGVVAALAAVGVLALLYGWPEVDAAGARVGQYGRYHQWLWVPAAAFLLLAEWLGHQPRETDDSGPPRRGALTHGTSSRTLRRDLIEAFFVKKMADVGVTLTVNKFGWHGTFETEARIDDPVIEHVERWVHAPAGSLMVGTDPRNAAARPFKLLIDDPLAKPDVPEKVVGRPHDIRVPRRVGRHLFGAPLMLNLRQHIGLIGRSGSGKSSGIWVLVDAICSCFNAEADGIDLTGGPAFPVWRRAIRRRGTDHDQAHSILDEAIALAMSRNAELARRAEFEDDSDLDENWDPSKDHPARFVFIDEFHVLADDKELLEKVKTVIRIGRKACVYLVLATPGASKEDLGSVIIKAMVGIKILFACVSQDVTNFLGGKMLEAGWRPDKLRPSAAGDPKDAGKAFVWDGDHQEPEVVRISRLSANDCRDRARAFDVTVLRPEFQGVPEPVQTPPLQVLADALRHYGQDRIPTREFEAFVTERVDDWSWKALRLALDELRVTSGQIGRGPWGSNARGYRMPEGDASAGVS